MNYVKPFTMQGTQSYYDGTKWIIQSVKEYLINKQNDQPRNKTKNNRFIGQGGEN